jgi:hypothetical protein
MDRLMHFSRFARAAPRSKMRREAEIRPHAIIFRLIQPVSARNP